jgi:hypothetical protein
VDCVSIVLFTWLDACKVPGKRLCFPAESACLEFVSCQSSVCNVSPSLFCLHLLRKCSPCHATFGSAVLVRSASRTGRLYPQECPWYSFSLGAESIPGSEGGMSLKNPVTPPGFDPGTVRLVAQRFNHYATPGPQVAVVESWFSFLVFLFPFA